MGSVVALKKEQEPRGVPKRGYLLVPAEALALAQRFEQSVMNEQEKTLPEYDWEALFALVAMLESGTKY
jgi:hypothetical protein